MAYSRQVTIGPEFFAKAKNDYSDYHFALIREFVQNGIDARGSKVIRIDIALENGSTKMTVSNDGEEMDENILVNKLLALGESGKNFEGTVGGMGKAKEVLYYTHQRYEITSGNLRVEGSGAGYDLFQTPGVTVGTSSTIWMAGDHVDRLSTIARNFIYRTQWSGTFYLNGTERKGDFRKGARRREFTWGTVYTNKSIGDELIVRIHGIPMFTRYVSANNRCVVVELAKGDASVLQSNRDSLKWEYQQELNSFIDELTVDKHSALRDVAPVYFHWDGEKCKSSVSKSRQKVADQLQAIVSEAYATVVQQQDDEPGEVAPVDVNSHISPHYPASTNTALCCEVATQNQISSEFVILNTTGMEVPAYYLPTSFSSYSLKLITIWTKAMLKLHQVFGQSGEFAVGFTFDETREAATEEHSKFGRVFYINPAVIVKQNYSNSRSLKKRWKLTPAGRWAIIADAVHEFAHLFHGPHDEDYAAKVTELFGVVLKERQAFNACFA